MYSHHFSYFCQIKILDATLFSNFKTYFSDVSILACFVPIGKVGVLSCEIRQASVSVGRKFSILKTANILVSLKFRKYF